MRVAESIERHGATKVAKAAGYPVTTIHRWKSEDRIPGKGKARELRERELKAAIAYLDAKVAEEVKATQKRRKHQ